MQNLQKAREARWARHPLSKFGDGPWRILPECPAISGHNTMQAARGRAGQNNRKTEPSCICPRARQLHDEYRNFENAKRRGEQPRSLRRERRAKVKSDMAEQANRVPSYISNVKPRSTGDIADLSRGRCHTEADGAWQMDRVIEGIDGAAQRARQELCGRCPVREACLEMALAHEAPAGAWGGLYGGLLPGERRRAAEVRRGLVAA